MNPIDLIRKFQGNALDVMGTVIGLPEIDPFNTGKGLSEWVAGGDTINTGRNVASSNILGNNTQPSMYDQPAGPALPTASAPTATGTGIAATATQPTQQQILEDIARRQREQQVGDLNNQYSNYERETNSLIDRIGGTYASVRDQAKNTLSSNLANLNKSTGDVKQGYGDLRTESSRLLNDTMLRNRLIARALGNLNSGFYQNEQGKANMNTQNAVSKIGTQERSQLDDIGLEMTNQENLNRTYEGDLLRQQTAEENSARDKLLGYKGDIERAVSNSGSELQSYLDNLGYQIASTKAQGGATRAVNPVQDMTDKIKLYSMINKDIMPTLNNQNALAQAYQNLNDGGDYGQIVGYLDKLDPSLSAQFQMNTKKQGGVNLPIIGNLGGKYTAPQAQTVNPQSYLDQLFR